MIDLGLGEAAYAAIAVPRDGETHPHALGLYASGMSLSADVLETYKPAPGEPSRLPLRAAEILRLDRHEQEVEAGRVLSSWAWCTACGERFVDGRARLGHAPLPTYADPDARPDRDNVRGGVAWHCSTCQDRPRRPATRLCGAPSCGVLYTPSDMRQLTCSDACRKALARERARHRSSPGRDLSLDPPFRIGR